MSHANLVTIFLIAAVAVTPPMSQLLQHNKFGDKKSLRLARDTVFAQYVSEWIERELFDSALISLEADVPAGVTIEVELRVRLDDNKISTWFPLGKCGVTSIKSEPRDGVSVETDVLRIALPQTAKEIQYRLNLEGDSPEVCAVTLVTYRRGERKPFAANRSPAWGKVLHVPQRSQMVEAPEIRSRICSPTSVAMVLEYFGVNLPTAEVAKSVHDAGAQVYGNWPFNTMFATHALRKKNIGSFVGRFSLLEELEEEVIAGRPAIISIRWKQGELTDAVVPSSDGHLLVVLGFTGNGDVVVNDPAANPEKAESVRRIYLRRDIYRCWLENGEGIVYLFRPKS